MECKYNASIALQLADSPFDELWEQCWDEVTSHHEMMRATIIEDEELGNPKHQVHNNILVHFLLFLITLD
jgi:hypothetical protein